MRVNRDFNGSILIEWMNGCMNESVDEWMNELNMHARYKRCYRERGWLQPGGCSVRRSYLSSYQLRILYTYISTLFCVCVCVCELTVSWQLKRLSRVYWPAAGAPKQQSCNSGLGYCNENLFKLENANCIRAVAEGRGCRLLVLVLMLSGLRLATWNALKIMLPARFGHLFCVMLDACCLLSGAAEKGQLELL